MKSPFSKSEIQNKIKRKEGQITAYNEQLTGLQTDLDALSTAYDNIQTQMSVFFDVYPDQSYVVPRLLDDDSWKGNKRAEFEYNFSDDYSTSLSALAHDSLDARDWIACKINDVDRSMKSIRREIKSLENDIWWLEKELRLAD